VLSTLDGYPNPWRFVPHPEVWLLVAFLIGSFVYLIRAVGPKVVLPGEPVLTARQRRCFVAAMLLLWLASDWPIHDIGEKYLYSVHMVQHMLLSYFMPPLVLLATPPWLARLLIGNGRAYRVLSWFSKPVVAGVMFNAVVMVGHTPTIVNRSSDSPPFVHYSVHLALVVTALLLWMSICGPLAELHIKPMGKMIALFLTSVVPTIPAGWLTMADGVVYKHYNIPVRVFGMSVTSDQQAAGAIMKLGGSAYLWTLITIMFIRHFRRNFNADNEASSYVRSATGADAPAGGRPIPSGTGGRPAAG
jgi:putative membrane protein